MSGPPPAEVEYPELATFMGRCFKIIVKQTSKFSLPQSFQRSSASYSHISRTNKYTAKRYGSKLRQSPELQLTDAVSNPIFGDDAIGFFWFRPFNLHMIRTLFDYRESCHSPRDCRKCTRNYISSLEH